MKIIGLICCRAGSKGIKNKNIKNFAGKPIINWIYEEIKKAKKFDEIYLSTDSRKLFKIGKKIGFISDLRPKYLATSTADVFDTHKYIFEKFKIHDKTHIVCCINNNPFIKKNHFVDTFKLFKKSGFKKTVMLAKKIDKENIFFRQSQKKKNTLYPIFRKNLINSQINRQSHSESYVNIGDLRWAKITTLSKYKNFNIEICKNGFSFLEVKNSEYLDLNTYKDWKLALNNFKKI